MSRAGRLSAIVAVLLATPGAAVDAASPPPPNARFDYQIGGDYRLPAGVRVVSRDWRIGRAPRGTYAICYVNSFQTQDDEPGVERPDERSAWPDDLVLTSLGDDPNWGGEYLVDISTADKRRRAADWVAPMIRTCKRKGFDAVEFDNLDSWTRFDDTPREGDVPFGKAEAIAFAALITKRAHRLGLAVGQKNTVELTRREARRQIGFDFAIAEECGRWDECQGYRDVYGNRVIAIEYRRQDFEKACAAVGSRISVVLRDVNVSRPGSRSYVYDSC
jgi:Glycoside-hydrolase family GH114